MKNDLDPKLIGTVVVLQVFRRQSDDSKELVPESLEKFVGTLLGYSVEAKTNSFVFQGMSQPLLISMKHHYFEIFQATKD